MVDQATLLGAAAGIFVFLLLLAAFLARLYEKHDAKKPIMVRQDTPPKMSATKAAAVKVWNKEYET